MNRASAGTIQFDYHDNCFCGDDVVKRSDADEAQQCGDDGYLGGEDDDVEDTNVEAGTLMEDTDELNDNSRLESEDDDVENTNVVAGSADETDSDSDGCLKETDNLDHADSDFDDCEVLSSDSSDSDSDSEEVAIEVDVTQEYYIDKSQEGCAYKKR